MTETRWEYCYAERKITFFNYPPDAGGVHIERSLKVMYLQPSEESKTFYASYASDENMPALEAVLGAAGWEMVTVSNSESPPGDLLAK